MIKSNPPRFVNSAYCIRGLVAIVAFGSLVVAAADTSVPASGTTPAKSKEPSEIEKIEKWFTQVDEPQQASYRRDVVQPFETALESLRKGYLAALDQRITAASSAGQLDVALGWRHERQRFIDAGHALPPDDADFAVPDAGHKAVAPALAPLRAQYRTQLTRLEQDRTARAQAAFAKYEAVVTPAITQLTKSRRLDEALVLKKKLEEIRTAWLTPNTTNTAAAAPSSRPSENPVKPSAPTTANATPAPSGNDRAAALMVLGKNSGEVRIEVGREQREVKAAADLPKGSFEVLVLRIPNASGKVQFSEEDMQTLSGLRKLEALQINETTLPEASLPVLRTLPKLTKLILQNNGITDEGLLHLAALENLTTLELFSCGRITGAGVLHLAPLKNLQELVLSHSGKLDGEALPAILKMRQIRVLVLNNSPHVDKSFLEALATLPKLQSLKLSVDQFTAPVELSGLKALRSLDIVATKDGTGMSETAVSSLGGLKDLETIRLVGLELTEPHLQQVARLLPALKTLVPDNARLPPSGLSALQGSKITRVEVTNNDKLFSDAALQSLVPIKSLKTVRLAPKSPVTAAGLSSFRKARPDIKVEGR